MLQIFRGKSKIVACKISKKFFKNRERADCLKKFKNTDTNFTSSGAHFCTKITTFLSMEMINLTYIYIYI